MVTEHFGSRSATHRDAPCACSNSGGRLRRLATLHCGAGKRLQHAQHRWQLQDHKGQLAALSPPTPRLNAGSAAQRLRLNFYGFHRDKVSNHPSVERAGAHFPWKSTLPTADNASCGLLMPGQVSTVTSNHFLNMHVAISGTPRSGRMKLAVRNNVQSECHASSFLLCARARPRPRPRPTMPPTHTAFRAHATGSPAEQPPPRVHRRQ